MRAQVYYTKIPSAPGIVHPKHPYIFTQQHESICWKMCNNKAHYHHYYEMNYVDKFSLLSALKRWIKNSKRIIEKLLSHNYRRTKHKNNKREKEKKIIHSSNLQRGGEYVRLLERHNFITVIIQPNDSQERTQLSRTERMIPTGNGKYADCRLTDKQQLLKSCAINRKWNERRIKRRRKGNREAAVSSSKKKKKKK